MSNKSFVEKVIFSKEHSVNSVFIQGLNTAVSSQVLAVYCSKCNIDLEGVSSDEYFEVVELMEKQGKGENIYFSIEGANYKED